MARPIGKYFEPVIKKLIDSRKSEDIVIDNRFKADLRMQILDKAMAMPRASRVDNMKERVSDLKNKVSDIKGHATEIGKGINQSWWTAWGGLWGQYKYAFALVPSALIVFVVVMQIAKMPTSIDSAVTVPVIDTSSRTAMTEESGDTRTYGAEVNNADANSVDVTSADATASVLSAGGLQDGAQSGIVTFSGYSVLPKEYRERYLSQTGIDQQAMTGGGEAVSVPGAQPSLLMQSVPVQQESSNVLQKSVTSVQPQAATTGNVQLKSLSVSDQQNNVDEQTQNSSRSLSDDSRVVAPAVVLPTTYDAVTSAASTGTAEMELVKSSVTPAAKVPATVNSIIAEPSVTTPTGTGGNTQATTSPAMPVVPTPVFSSPVVPVTVAPTILSSYTIDYETSMTDADKLSLESRVIKSLADGKNVAYVKVSKNTDGYIQVDVYFNDGSKYTAYYTRGASSGTWQEVRYTSKSTGGVIEYTKLGTEEVLEYTRSATDTTGTVSTLLNSSNSRTTSAVNNVCTLVGCR